MRTEEAPGQRGLHSFFSVCFVVSLSDFKPVKNPARAKLDRTTLLSDGKTGRRNEQKLEVRQEGNKRKWKGEGGRLEGGK